MRPLLVMIAGLIFEAIARAGGRMSGDFVDVEAWIESVTDGMKR
jgi:hypothetical protein